MKNKIVFYIVTALVLFSTACKKLEVKPRESLVVPSTLQDFQGIMDNSDVMNTNFCSLAEISADNYYVTDAIYNSITPTQHQNAYIWRKDIFKGVAAEFDWEGSYQRVFYSNVVLDGIAKISANASNQNDYNNIKGQALFHRAFNFYDLAQEFSPLYSAQSATTDLGIVLRLTSDLNVTSTRSNVQATYDRIIEDLSAAKNLLPVTPLYKTRPSKPAAFGALARVYLAKQDYKNALLNADSCLKLYGTLIDYNTVSPALTYPFAQFNDEVIFHGTASSIILLPGRALVDSTLYKSYEANDLRKTLFFTNSGGNTYKFRGSYCGTRQLMEGIASDEIYLIRAECNARLGNTAAAMNDYNQLLSTRYVSGKYVPVTASSPDDALAKILTERRKELLMRGLRWPDLRRLNKDSRFAVTLSRMVNSVTYTLLPGDTRYTLQIPEYIINLNGITQNP